MKKKSIEIPYIPPNQTYTSHTSFVANKEQAEAFGCEEGEIIELFKPSG